MKFGVSVLKGISGNKHTTHFVMYNMGLRDHLLSSIVDTLPTDMQRHFIIGTYKYGATYPCISRYASGESTDSIVVVYSSLLLFILA